VTEPSPTPKDKAPDTTVARRAPGPTPGGPGVSPTPAIDGDTTGSVTGMWRPGATSRSQNGVGGASRVGGAGGMTPQLVLALQGRAGNRAVVHELGRRGHAGVQGGAAPVQREPDTGNPAVKAAARALEARCDKVTGQAETRHSAVMDFVKDGLADVDAARGELDGMMQLYDTAFERMSATLQEAGEALQLQDDAIDAVLGVAIGVAMGLGVGEIIVVAEGASLAARAGVEAVGEMGEWWAAQHVGDASKAGRAATPSATTPGKGLRPEVQRLEIYQRLTDLYRGLAKVSLEARPFAGLLAASGRGKADCRELATSGQEKGKLTLAQVGKQVGALEQMSNAQKQVETTLSEAKAPIARLQEDVRLAVDAKTASDLEHDMWIHWMGSLSREQAERVLDADAVEERLEALGLQGQGSHIGYDPGAITSAEDTFEGTRHAYWESVKLKLVGRRARIHSVVGATTLLDVPGYPKLWRADVGGGAKAPGVAVIITGVSNQRLQARVSPGAQVPHVEWQGPREPELEYAGETHRPPGSSL
jgi:hypothetical protein